MLHWEPKNGDRSDLTLYLERPPGRPISTFRKQGGPKSDPSFTFCTPWEKHVPHMETMPPTPGRLRNPWRNTWDPELQSAQTPLQLDFLTANHLWPRCGPWCPGVISLIVLCKVVPNLLLGEGNAFHPPLEVLLSEETPLNSMEPMLSIHGLKMRFRAVLHP